MGLDIDPKMSSFILSRAPDDVFVVVRLPPADVVRVIDPLVLGTLEGASLTHAHLEDLSFTIGGELDSGRGCFEGVEAVVVGFDAIGEGHGIFSC